MKKGRALAVPGGVIARASHPQANTRKFRFRAANYSPAQLFMID